jgi:hypothetical protein
VNKHSSSSFCQIVASVVDPSLFPMQSEHIGQTDVDNDHCNGSSQTSIEVTSNMVPEEMMEDCPVDNRKEDSSLCKNVLSESTEPCPGNLCYQ